MSQTTKNDQRSGSLVQVGARLPMPADSGIAPEQWRVLTDAIWPSAKTAEAVKLAFDYCKARNLDPFKRPVHIVPMWSKALNCEVETVWPGISETQTTAARTGEWAGMDPPQWGPDVTRVFEGKKKEWVNGKSVWNDLKIEVTYPESCCVTVYRMVKGQPRPFTEPVYWIESYATMGKSDVPNDMWARRARGQLHKCAKAASLRAAFPEELGNSYTAEEMEGKVTDAGGVVIDGTAEREPSPTGIPTMPREPEAPAGKLDMIAGRLAAVADQQREAAQIDLRGQQQNQAPNVAANVVPPPPESPELELRRKKRKGAERFATVLAADIKKAIQADTTPDLVVRSVLLVISNEHIQNKLNDLKLEYNDLYNVVLDACCDLTVLRGVLDAMEIAYNAFCSDLKFRAKWPTTPSHTTREPIEEVTN